MDIKGKDIANELKQLVLDDDFLSLQNLGNEEVNLMQILRVSRKELQHSNFLAWFFDPAESHGLGDIVLKEFIKLYFKENEVQDLGETSGLSVFDFVHMDFDDLEIRREYRNIDLLLLSEKNNLCIVIENKIDACEREGQLLKYREIVGREYGFFKHKIFIFLSLEDQIISESERNAYVQLNYGHIIKLIELIILNKRLKLASKTQFVLEQYLQTLKSMLNENEEIEKIARQLYRRYKSAFDLVMKYSAPTDTSELWDKLEKLLLSEEAVVPFHNSKSYLRFQPKYLYKNIDKLRSSGLISPTDDLKNNWLLLFEFNFKGGQIVFDCKIGEGDVNARLKLYTIYKKYQNVFTKVSRPNDVLSKWHNAFQKVIIGTAELQRYNEGDTVEIDKILEKRFRELIDIDMPKIIECIEKEI